jgi:signal transduction histidine kinase
MTIENMRKNLNSIDYGSLEEKDKVTAMQNIAAITQMIPKIVKDLSEAERAVE